MTDDLSPEMIALYKKAWDKWGMHAQLTMINEECAEVIHAVCKLLRKPKGTDEFFVDNVVEEIADATIMFEQFLSIYDVGDDFHVHRERKLVRLEEKIKQ